ncbi:SET domain protein [Fusarium sp. NRRL 52700]|nr:SET domain protein [Fusarium sp. NRRL 52700]
MEDSHGFDMLPRLSSGGKDQDTWKHFSDNVKTTFKDDDKVKVRDNYIQFDVGQNSFLPFEGHKFLRFSGNPLSYSHIVLVIMRMFFGPRVREWDDICGECGYYSQNEVSDSVRLYEQPDPPSSIHAPLFEVRDIPEKGRGLIAKVDIPAGTRILCEKPLLQASTTTPGDLEATAAPRLKALSQSQQRKFLSLHNSFPGEHPLNGIIRTNALPCGPGSIVGGVYLTISLVNHSCLPNSLNNWNSVAGHETIHAIRPIKAGEEITIYYYKGGPSIVRRPILK